MSNITIFNFENSPVRTAIKNGNEPYFCLTDVTEILAVNRRSSEAFNLDPKGVQKINLATKGGKQDITFISEPNLYRVIFRSNKPEAVKFQNWVFDDVLPSIRKTGSYHRPSTVKDRTPLRQAVSALVGKCGLPYDEAYAMVHQYMGVEHIDEIAMDALPSAVAYVHMLNMACGKKPQDDIISHNIHNLVWHTAHIYRWYKAREDAFYALSSQIASGVHDHITHAKAAANRLHREMNFTFDRDCPRRLTH